MNRFRSECRTARRPRSRGELLTLGVSRGKLAGPRWRLSSRGYYVPASVGRNDRGELTPAQRILDAIPTLPIHGAFGGWAAAYVRGAEWLDGTDPSGRTIPVPILLGCELHRLAEKPRLVRARLGAAERRTVAGIPLSSLERTAFDGARWAENMAEAVVFLDAMLHFTRLSSARLRA